MLLENPDSGVLVLLMVLLPCRAGDIICSSRGGTRQGRRVR